MMFLTKCASWLICHDVQRSESRSFSCERMVLCMAWKEQLSDGICTSVTWLFSWHWSLTFRYGGCDVGRFHFPHAWRRRHLRDCRPRAHRLRTFDQEPSPQGTSSFGSSTWRWSTIIPVPHFPFTMMTRKQTWATFVFQSNPSGNPCGINFHQAIFIPGCSAPAAFEGFESPWLAPYCISLKVVCLEDMLRKHAVSGMCSPTLRPRSTLSHWQRGKEKRHSRYFAGGGDRLWADPTVLASSPQDAPCRNQTRTRALQSFASNPIFVERFWERLETSKLLTYNQARR